MQLKRILLLMGLLVLCFSITSQHVAAGTIDESANQFLTKSNITEAQKGLTRLGYDIGTPDGILGAKTKKAIEKYQQTRGLTVTKTLSRETLISLGIAIDDKVIPVEKTIDRTDKTNESELIAEAQKYLTRLGYEPGPPNGLMTDKTKTALGQYQQSRGLETTRLLDNQTLYSLGIKTSKFSINKQASEIATDNIHLFQSFFEDAPITTSLYVDFGLDYKSYDKGRVYSIGAQGGYPVTPKIELNMAFHILYGDYYSDYNGYYSRLYDDPYDYDYGDAWNDSWDAAFGDNEIGISDLYIGGKYNIIDEIVKVTAGGFVTIPVGTEDVGQGNFDFGVNCSLRHSLREDIVLTGTGGIVFLEEPDTTSIQFGAGCIYSYSDQMHLVGEFIFKTEVDFMMFSGGIDYMLNSGNSLRSALGIGTDDGAPDYELSVSYCFY